MSSKPVLQKILEPTNTYNKHRKPIIRRLQKRLKAKVVTYISSPYHRVPSIMIQDIPFFEELLRSVSGSDTGYLMINSPGGDGNVAEKMLMMCRQRFTKTFNVIIPDYAKSAATMLALGSDKMLMGYLAELGPIDPQIRTMTGPTIPARSLIDGLELIRDKIKNKKDPVQMYIPMLYQIRPEIIVNAQNAIDHSEEFAKKWLKKYMLKGNKAQADKVAEWLSRGKKYKSHGKVIDFTEAKKVLKLNVDRIDPASALWSDIWELYCRSIVFLQKGQKAGAAKLYESESVSFTLNLQIIGPKVPITPPPRRPLPSIPIRPPKPQPQPKPSKPSSK